MTMLQSSRVSTFNRWKFLLIWLALGSLGQCQVLSKLRQSSDVEFPRTLLDLAQPGQALAEPSSGPPLVTASDFFPLDQIKVGTSVTAWTIFEGDRIESFSGTILGVAPAMFGPERDIVIVRFSGEKVEHTGIVHGMSGSPVYVGNRLLGAIALALSPFPKDAVAGIMPIQTMVADANRDGWQTEQLRLRKKGPDGSVPAYDRGIPFRQTLPDARLAAWHPLSLPLSASGLDPAVYSHYADRFGGYGFGLGNFVAGASNIRPEPADLAAPADKAKLMAGAGIAVVLMAGDLSLAATGTVTYVDGNQVYAFGHPFLQRGTIQLPIATADIITTIADFSYPFKLANVGTLVGTLTHDGVSAIFCRLGPVPDFLPVQVIFEGETSSRFDYAVISHPDLTPLLVQLAISNSAKKVWKYEEAGTFHFALEMRFKGGRVLTLDQTHAVRNSLGNDEMFSSIDTLVEPLAQILQNPFETVELASVALHVKRRPAYLEYRLQDVRLDTTQVQPGQTLSATVVLKPEMGQEVYRTLPVLIPPGMEGARLKLRFLDAATLKTLTTHAGAIPLSQLKSLDQTFKVAADQARNDQLYVQLVREAEGLTLQHQVLPQLPTSVLELLTEALPTEERTLLDQAVVWESELWFDGPVSGTRDIELSIRGRSQKKAKEDF